MVFGIKQRDRFFSPPPKDVKEAAPYAIAFVAIAAIGGYYFWRSKSNSPISKKIEPRKMDEDKEIDLLVKKWLKGDPKKSETENRRAYVERVDYILSDLRCRDFITLRYNPYKLYRAWYAHLDEVLVEHIKNINDNNGETDWSINGLVKDVRRSFQNDLYTQKQNYSLIELMGSHGWNVVNPNSSKEEMSDGEMISKYGVSKTEPLGVLRTLVKHGAKISSETLRTAKVREVYWRVEPEEKPTGMLHFLLNSYPEKITKEALDTLSCDIDAKNRRHQETNKILEDRAFSDSHCL